jgi:Tat protein translocase TatB subunit
MFEVGFTEIILILGLALLVLGPEKLPGLAQKVGRWTGRARSMARQLRNQLEQEVTLEEMAKSRPPPAPTPAPAPATEAPAAEHLHDTPSSAVGTHTDASQDSHTAQTARPPYPSESDAGHTEIDSNNSGHGDIGAAPEPAPAAAMDPHKSH